jgi:uncharacterized repeat protein (TIGR03803 family)
VDIATGVLTTLIEFTNNGVFNKGRRPYAALVDDGGGFFWGSTFSGGANDYGTIFKLNPATGVLITVVEFTGNGATDRGSKPYGALTNDGNGFFWGTTNTGGTSDRGTVFKLNAATGVLTTIADFVSSMGTYPRAALVSDGAGSLLGSTSYGGEGNGSLFKIDPATGVLTTFLHFTNSYLKDTGRDPNCSVVSDGNGFIWGTTASGGKMKVGTVYKLNPVTGVLTTVIDFTGATGSFLGAGPRGGLVQDAGGFLWGCIGGSTRNDGMIFRHNGNFWGVDLCSCGAKIGHARLRSENSLQPILRHPSTLEDRFSNPD